MTGKKRLIDANVLWKALDKAHLFDDGNPRHIAQQTVEEQPTVDAVEVVRCKDCTQYNGHRYCRYTELIVLDNDFCSYGERKDNV